MSVRKRLTEALRRRLPPRRWASGRILLTALRPFVGTWLVCWSLQVAWAQEPPADDPSAPAAHEASEREPLLADVVEQERARRRAYNVGVVLVGGILICGVGLIALVLLWGNRARRIARQPLPKVAPVDELWYLKGKSNFGGESAGESTDDSSRGEAE